MHPHFSGNMGKDFVTIFEFDTEHGVRQRLGHSPFQDDRVFLGLGQGTSPTTLVDKPHRRTAREHDALPRRREILAIRLPRHQSRFSQSPVHARSTPKTVVNGPQTVRISGPDSVIAMVCSQWADHSPSAVTTPQPSASTRVSGEPMLTMGSTANTFPSRNFGPRP